MPLPRPARCNRGYFCKRGSSGHQDITVVTLPDRSHLIKYVEMGTHPRNNVMILSSSRHRHLDGSSRCTTTSSSDNDDDYVRDYWTATI